MYQIIIVIKLLKMKTLNGNFSLTNINHMKTESSVDFPSIHITYGQTQKIVFAITSSDLG